MTQANVSFGGSMPKYYDLCLGPAWFDAFAVDLAQRLPAGEKGDVLELACGTGIVTRRLRERLAPRRRLVASDISKGMLDYASEKLANFEGIEWCEADAAKLPFENGAFGVVVCAFGAMFVPDKKALYGEVHRTLERAGTFLFNVWDRIEENPTAVANARVVEALFPGDPEVQLKTPYEMHDVEAVSRQLVDAGFTGVHVEKKRVDISISALTIAQGQVRGTPRAQLLEKRGASLDDVVQKVAAALAEQGGDPWRGPANAWVIEARAA
jgi:SAM-dependent methyltransferase